MLVVRDRRRVPVRRRRRPRRARSEFNDDATPALLIVAGASIAFYALIGFEDAVNVAEETKDSTRTFPRTLFLGPRRGRLGLPAGDDRRRHGRARRHARGVRRPAAGGRHPGPAGGQQQGLLRDRPVRADQRLPAEPRDGQPADVRDGQRERRPRRSSARSTPAAGRRGWRSSSPRRSPPCSSASATSRRSPTRPCCCCCSSSSASTRRCCGCATSPPTTSTSAPGRSCPTSASPPARASPIQQVVDDPKLVLWAGGLIVFGLILWVIERAVR